MFGRSAAAADSLAPAVVVLDAFGSMTEADIGGQARMDAAKQAAKEFLNQTPADAQLGLVTYGTGTGGLGGGEGGRLPGH